MNRTQFWIVNSLAILVVLLLIAQVALINMEQAAQFQVSRAQYALQAGQAYETRLRQLALRIFQVSQQTQDQGLKDLLTRQDIRINVPPANGAAPNTDNGSTVPTPSTPAH